MNYDVFKNKNVLITGSSSGIGNVIGKKFLENKSNVIFTGRGKLKDNFIQNKNKYKYFKGDLTIEKTIDELYKFVLKNFTSNLDILICNLGGGKIENKTKYTKKEWYNSFNLNFFSTVLIIQKLHSLLKNSSSPSIVCISSICGNSAIGCPITYSVAKAALNNYVKNYSKLIGKENIRINSISPGNIMFQGSTWEDKLEKYPEEISSYIENNVPLNMFGSPLHIADLVLFLSSPLSNFTTGANFVLDGGQSNV
jgi:3-oxoacyl-[acyl-carrier protein] reductase